MSSHSDTNETSETNETNETSETNLIGNALRIVARTWKFKCQFCAVSIASFAGLGDEVALGDTNTLGEEGVDLSAQQQNEHEDIEE